MKTKINLYNPQGSILVYSLIIMFVVLTITLGITRVVTTQQKTSSNTSRSIQAIQIANSGIEKVLTRKKDDNNTTIKDLADSPGDCEHGVVTYSINGGTVEIHFFDSGETLITNCNVSKDNIRYIKAVGEISRTKRAIRVEIS